MAIPNTTITPSATVLALIGDPQLREDVSRVAAAAGVGLVVVDDPSGRKAWTAAAAVLLDAAAALRCARRGLPRRPRVILVGHVEPQPDDWQAAVSVGAQHVMTLPTQDAALVAVLSEADCRDDGGRGPAVAVVSARGGAGASVFAVALAQSASAALLIEADPWSGGIDLVAGSEDVAGLRWPDLALQGGRLGYPALREALPRRDGVSVLSSGRSGADIEAGPVAAVIEAGCRGGVTVVCDVPRRATEAAETALNAADLVVLVAPADVRSCTAATAARPWVLACNPNAGVVVRGPSPGGLRATEVARIVDLPLLAAMRPQAGIAEVLERGGLRVRPRSPLGSAARRVLSVLAGHPVQESA
ncbi:AAA family ATPase [Mycolicibacterium peregrinum]|uniref:septum site-determining protein Ssd n=1 Tax=Mycolicibacterium peregrinum TaxID=43304 RepID=UPI000A1526A2|nr:septum site-determining protein Ssd [Mycolicibacterium peregrinum]ORW54072.1 AAA family ATPase [Mycolicibacterium peregrinum]OWL97082.1 AAA family ATPase [Mycolicibacterium peregrinum]